MPTYLSKSLLLTVITGLVLNIVCQISKENKKPTHPNILLIVIDDLKPLLGSYDDPYVHSPHMDKLANRGNVFRKNYCQQAVCGPSRANLLTGLRPDHTRVWNLSTRMRDENPNILSMPQYFKMNGYETAGIGKVYDQRCVDKDLDAPSWSIPFFKRSMDYYAQDNCTPRSLMQDQTTVDIMRNAKKDAAGKGLKGKEASYYVKENSIPSTECVDVPDNAYIDGAKVEHARVILKDLSRGDKPFFLAVGITKPHLPFTAPKKYWDLYDRDKLPLATFRENSKNTPKLAFHRSGEIMRYMDIHPIANFSEEKLGMELPLEKQKELIHGYYACVSYADELVGKLLKTLEDLSIDDNTIVVVIGDHGWHLGDHNLWCKHSNFENAVQTPLIISAPGYEPAHTQALSEFVDVFPTLCELSHLDIPDGLDGVSLVPIIQNPDTEVKKFAMSQYPRGSEYGKTMGYSLRTDRYRYTIWMKNDYRSTMPFDESLIIEKELYDYTNDPLETINMVGDPSYANVIEELQADMVEFMSRQ